MIRVFTMKAVGKDFLAASWSPYLTEERKKLADRKKGERERQLFLGAEVLLNLSLQQVDARIPIPAKYKRNEHGKPYLEDRQGIYVNWSHSGDYVICAVADREVGIDLQYAGKEPKESLLKVLGTGFATPLDRFYVEFRKDSDVSDAVKKNAMKVPYIIQNINHKQYLCRLLSVKDEGYTAALCIESLDKSLQEGELFSTLDVEEIEE